jgi:hypothetical protein
VILCAVHPAFEARLSESDLLQRLFRVQDFGLTGAARHWIISTYLGFRPAMIVQSQLTGAI